MKTEISDELKLNTIKIMITITHIREENEGEKNVTVRHKTRRSDILNLTKWCMYCPPDDIVVLKMRTREKEC
jgi:hypothetical protein